MIIIYSRFKAIDHIRVLSESEGVIDRVSNVTPFDCGGHQIRIVRDEAGAPWFVAADICRCLGLAVNKRTGKPNVTVATRDLNEIQKRKYRIDTPENPKNPWIDMMILSEEGFYKMLRNANSLDVQGFKQHVQQEIMPCYNNGASAKMCTS